MYNDSTKTFLILPVLLVVFILVGCQNNHKKNKEVTPEILCLTLRVSHGCESLYYTDEELEQYITNDVLTKITAEEAEKIILEEKESILSEINQMNEDELNTAKELQEEYKIQCEKQKIEAEAKAREMGQIVKNETCGSVGIFDRLNYIDRVLSVIQKLQAKVDVSDWQTYTNKEFGFEVKYPPTTTWHTIPRPDSGTQEIEYTSVPTQILLTKKDDVWAPEGGFAVGFGCGVPNQSVDFGVTVHPKTNQQYEQIILKDLHYDIYHTLHTKKIVNTQGVTGVEVAIQTQNNTCSIYSTSVFFEKNDFVYEINHMGECGEEFSGFTEKEQAFIDHFAFL